MKRRFNKRVKALFALTGLCISTLELTAKIVTKAETFSAICGTLGQCLINVEKGKISTPYGIIPTSRVASWGGTGSSQTDLILGGAATYLLGPIGLIGFAAKTHDYKFEITGYDLSGDKINLRLQFLNSKPAQRFAQTMAEATAMGMHQSRTAKEILELESKMKAEGVEWPGALKSENLFKSRYSKTEKKFNQREGCKQINGLENDSNLQKWAKSNPSLAERLASECAE